MKKPSSLPKRATIFLLAPVMGCCCLFVVWTFPWSHNDAPSVVTVEWLPREEWGFHSFCFFSSIAPGVGSSYGPILVTRKYDFRRYIKH